jgi:hypothetical protein
MDGAYLDAMSGTTLQKKFTQTRIEFWGEGKSYLWEKQSNNY